MKCKPKVILPPLRICAIRAAVHTNMKLKFNLPGSIIIFTLLMTMLTMMVWVSAAFFKKSHGYATKLRMMYVCIKPGISKPHC